MAGETFVGIAYRGIELGRRARLEATESGAAHLHFNAPMPVGSEIAIVIDDGPTIPLRVLQVQEQVAGADRSPGMRVVPTALAGDSGVWWRDHIGEVVDEGDGGDDASTSVHDSAGDDTGQDSSEKDAGSGDESSGDGDGAEQDDDRSDEDDGAAGEQDESGDPAGD